MSDNLDLDMDAYRAMADQDKIKTLTGWLDTLTEFYRRAAAERDEAHAALEMLRRRVERLEAIRAAADNGEWHSSEDCRVEGRCGNDGGCDLCAALEAAAVAARDRDAVALAALGEVAHAK